MGVDGCPAGWIWVGHDGRGYLHGVASDFQEVVERAGEDGLVLVDIPIGLPEGPPAVRACDREARRLLSPRRHTSVFPVPCRQALDADSYEEASARNREVLDRGLSKQSWNLLPRIREVDEILRARPELVGRVRECHPELVFRGLAGAPATASKTTREGCRERLDLLAARSPALVGAAGRAYLEHGGWDATRDDVLDAAAALLCARRIDQCATVPEEPPRDPRGLPMEMVWLPR
jgi:predicted RNase H-like nuclease